MSCELRDQSSRSCNLVLDGRDFRAQIPPSEVLEMLDRIHIKIHGNIDRQFASSIINSKTKRARGFGISHHVM